MSNFDAVQRAITLAEMMGGSIAMGYAHRHEVQAYKTALRDHLRAYLPDHPAPSDAEDAKDAERYRFVCKQFRAMSLDMGGQHCWVLARSGALRGPTIEAAIDAAMAKEKQG